MLQQFYDDLASIYHLLFDDWQAEITRQGNVLGALLRSPERTGPVLDIACGIGTQVFALADLGYTVEGSDLSPGEIRRAHAEAAKRGLTLHLRPDDMRTLSTAPIASYGAVLCMGNSVSHLVSDKEILQMLLAARDRLQPGGTLIMSLRDYERAMAQRQASTPPAFYNSGARRRIVHHVWDWEDDRNYVFHVYLTLENERDWTVHHFVGHCRAIRPRELASLAEQAGFDAVQVLDSERTGYYQVIVTGKLSD